MFAVMSLTSNTAPHTLNLEDPEPGPWSEHLIRRAPQKLPPRPKQVIICLLYAACLPFS